MKIKINRFAPIAFTVALGLFVFSSCKDDKPGWDGVEVRNGELKALLQARGYTFDAEGKLVQDSKVLNTTSLDLSDCGLSDFSGLDVFPNLEEVDLSDNKIYKIFDFGVLPATVNSVDLTGNEIYEYSGLVNVETHENGDETVTQLRELKKLYLPQEARYNCDQVVYFYLENKVAVDDGTIEMELMNGSGSMEKYTTLREVPDPAVRAYLSENFPSMFSGEKIDIGKRLMKAIEKGRGIILDGLKYPEMTNVEGFEYIAMNKGFEGGAIELTPKVVSKIQYLKVKSNANSLILANVEVACMDLSEATKLCTIWLTKNPYLEELDLTSNTSIGQRSDILEFMENGSKILIGECENFKRIKFPAKANRLSSLQLYLLPELEKLDISQFEAMGRLGLAVDCRIVYPDIQYFVLAGKKDEEKGVTHFAITEDVYNMPETKAFLDKYHDKLRRTGIAFPTSPSPSGLKFYNWTKHYK